MEAGTDGMREKITFTIPGDPPRVTAQQKGQNRATGAYYKPQKLRDAEDLYYLSALAHRPPRPFQGPVALTVATFFLEELQVKAVTAVLGVSRVFSWIVSPFFSVTTLPSAMRTLVEA